MKVFISWSGPKSKAVANYLKRWIKFVLQNSQPWVSTHDIERGRVAMTQLIDTLNESKIGIICLTPRNHEKPWILFEAGAISSKFDESRVLTLLLDGLKVEDLNPPLGLFQATYPDKESMKSLLWTINQLMDAPLEPETFNDVFETYWPQFNQEYTRIINEVKEDGPVIERNESDKLDEILMSIRRFDNRISNLEIDKTITENRSKNIVSKIRNYLLKHSDAYLGSTDLAAQIVLAIKSHHDYNLVSNVDLYNLIIKVLKELNLDNNVKEEALITILKQFDISYLTPTNMQIDKVITHNKN
jgi:hypothetical protein